MSEEEETSSSGIPLIHLPLQATPQVSKEVVQALETSGFLLITSPLVPRSLQQAALKQAQEYLQQQQSSSSIVHPTDPKQYAMLDNNNKTSYDGYPVLKQYQEALERVKQILLECIAIGLELEDSMYFCNLHQENNSCMRLLHYFPATPETGNRCKEHSDYGTITLLCTDGVSGLEAWVENQWTPVPLVQSGDGDGALVVNIGSLLSDWTRNELKATLHRVAGPASSGTTLDAAELQQSRTSIAYFCDPDPHVTANLQESKSTNTMQGATLSVKEYIAWRSGGADDSRSGIAFTNTEKKRVEGEVKSANQR